MAEAFPPPGLRAGDFFAPPFFAVAFLAPPFRPADFFAADFLPPAFLPPEDREALLAAFAGDPLARPDADRPPDVEPVVLPADDPELPATVGVRGELKLDTVPPPSPLVEPVDDDVPKPLLLPVDAPPPGGAPPIGCAPPYPVTPPDPVCAG